MTLLYAGLFGYVLDSPSEEEEDGDDDSLMEEIAQKASKSPVSSLTSPSKKAKKLNDSSESSPAAGKHKGKSPKSKGKQSVTQVNVLLFCVCLGRSMHTLQCFWTFIPFFSPWNFFDVYVHVLYIFFKVVYYY